MDFQKIKQMLKTASKNSNPIKSYGSYIDFIIFENLHNIC